MQNKINKEQPASRIKLLDGFRCIAILLVVVFHYFCRWTPPRDVNLYPYGGRFRNPLFDTGGNGVEFFFIISGFVIYFTLQRSKNIFDFLYRRFVRLWPTLLLCSVVTFFIIVMFDKGGYFGQLTKVVNFIPSLLFTDPGTLKHYFNIDTNFMDGAYWSLVVEVRFYIIIAIVYFIFPNVAFIKKWSFIFAGILLLHSVNRFFHLNPTFSSLFLFVEALLLYNYLSYFTFGIFCFEYFLKRKITLLFVIPLFIMFRTIFLLPVNTATSILFALFFVLFIVFLIRPGWLFFLQQPIILRMGVISYAIYLLHQSIGIILINRFMVNHSPLFMVIVPVVVYGVIALTAELITRYYEPAVKKLLFSLPWFKSMSTKFAL